METWHAPVSTHGNVDLLLVPHARRMVSPKRLEARRVAMVRRLRKVFAAHPGRVVVTPQPTFTVARTSKPVGARMGKGKGGLLDHRTPVTPGVPVHGFTIHMPPHPNPRSVLRACRKHSTRKLGVRLVLRVRLN